MNFYLQIIVIYFSGLCQTTPKIGAVYNVHVHYACAASRGIKDDRYLEKGRVRRNQGVDNNCRRVGVQATIETE